MSWTGYGVDEVLGPHLLKLILGAIKTGLDLHKCQSGIKCLAACPLGRKNAMTGSTGRMHRRARGCCHNDVQVLLHTAENILRVRRRTLL